MLHAASFTRDICTISGTWSNLGKQEVTLTENEELDLNHAGCKLIELSPVSPEISEGYQFFSHESWEVLATRILDGWKLGRVFAEVM